ncbi:DUF2855 family protein [Chelatococcus reniformis]|uniref:DUF2855 domain-containing protein n=1 Tax=Chelatococcus reniformis TaxID=1494448 RepID=A0A916XN80_9HYPH|nr:DUF2855 family protein [Chelatococcus reniformis]GGC84925.1 hypothetical protein GCM10010994_48520 [Chelatococcus reniformis]
MIARPAPFGYAAAMASFIQHGPAATSWTLEVARTDVHRTRVVAEVDGRPPEPGEVVLAVERFALSANNLTYAATGDTLGYWQLFPAAAGWGRIPAWGHAVVVASGHDDVRPGERYFGLVPMGSRFSILASRSRLGLRDDSPHRAGLNPVYNQYAATHDNDAVRLENDALFRPLLIASFVLDAFLRENAFFGAGTVVVISASSKVALGLATLLHGSVPVAGLTSRRNVGFVEATRRYEPVLAYDDLDRLPRFGPSVVIDLAGDAALAGRVTAALGDGVVRAIRVGSTHWDAGQGQDADAFFAPTHIQRLVKAWGPGGFEERLSAALDRFADLSAPWFARSYADGPEALTATYASLADGRADPARLQIARPAR